MAYAGGVETRRVAEPGERGVDRVGARNDSPGETRRKRARSIVWRTWGGPGPRPGRPRVGRAASSIHYH